MLTPFKPAVASMCLDVRLLFAARIARLFAYGALGVVLVIYLAASGIEDQRIGLLLSLTLVGDTIVSLWLATRADRFGRRRTLIAGAWLMLIAGLTFALPALPFALLLFAATVGVISPSGNEVGPFLPVEQAALAQLVPPEQRTGVFGWYTLAGSLATAAGSVSAGLIATVVQVFGGHGTLAHQVVLILYAATGVVLLLLFYRLSSRIEIESPTAVSAPAMSPLRAMLGLHESRSVVLHLSLLFCLDAFGGGFIIQSLLAYWFHVRFGVDVLTLGSLFFAANILAGFSALAATRMAARYGLVATMVFTHLPSNLLLILVPFMPSYGWAAGVLLCRFAISQMDVPARQSYTMAVVTPHERSAAAAFTGVARTAGAAIAPVIAAPMITHEGWQAVPFFVAGGLKIVYDLLLWRSFKSVKQSPD